MTAQPQVSKHILDKKRRNRRQIIWTTSLAVITVLGMTLYDLKYRSYKTYHLPDITNHFVTDAAQLSALPDDYTTVTVYQGNVGDTPAIDDGIAPVNLPQRQVDLVFDMANIDISQQKAAIDEINAALLAWQRKSNIVSDAILDTRTPPKMTGQEMVTFITALRESHKLEYRASLIVNPRDAANPVVAADAETRAALKKQITALAFYGDDATITDDVAVMDTLGFPFYIIVPHGTDADSYHNETLGKSKSYRGLIVAAAPATESTPDAP